jgi:hypothetical protein
MSFKRLLPVRFAARQSGVWAIRLTQVAALAVALWDRRSLFVVCQRRGASCIRQTTKSDGLSHPGLRPPT